MIKKGDLYYPSKEFQKRAWVKNKKIYKEAGRNPKNFWANLAKQLFWFKPWKKTFVHKPPYFQWFVGGRINITANIFEKNLLGWEKIKNKTALIWEPEPINEESKFLTYEVLFNRVKQFANALKKLGVKKGDRVGIYLPMIPEVIISMLACTRIGAIHLVVFSAFSPEALRKRLFDCEAKILITCDGYFRRGKIINLKENADEGIKGTNVEKIIVVKRLKREVPFNSKVDIFWDDLIKNESDFCQAEILDSEDPLFILPESGTMGEYLPILHTIGGYTVQAYWTGKWIFDLKENSILWCTSDIGWITGHTYAVYSPLLNGITTILYEGAPDYPTPDRWAKIIEKYGATIFYTAPTAIRMFRKNENLISKYKFESLRVLGSVGEPIDEGTWLWYYEKIGKKNCPIVDTWWQTETGGILITSLPGIGPFKPAFTGLPLPGTKFDILDEKGKPCPTGQTGNLVMYPPFAPGLLRGIYKNPEKYLETYWNQYAALEIVKGEPRPTSAGPGQEIYFTSDAAYKDKNGLIRIIGRVDDVLKVAGHRIATGELENAVNLHPEITECAVVGIPDEIKGEVPIIFLVYKGPRAVGDVKKEVVEQIKKQIGPIASPKEIFLVDDLPKTRSGKIMRRIFKKLWLGEELGDLSTLANPEAVVQIKRVIEAGKRH